RTSPAYLVAALERLGPFAYRIAVDEEAREREGIERRQQFGPGAFCGMHLRGERDHLAHPDDRGIHGRHRDQRVEVHPWRQHAFDALRQDDEVEALAPRKSERASAVP